MVLYDTFSIHSRKRLTSSIGWGRDLKIPQKNPSTSVRNWWANLSNFQGGNEVSPSHPCPLGNPPDGPEGLDIHPSSAVPCHRLGNVLVSFFPRYRINARLVVDCIRHSSKSFLDLYMGLGAGQKEQIEPV